MSFGFSVGDCILVAQIVSDLTSAYQSAPAGFEGLTASLETFRGVVHGIERDLRDRRSRLSRASPEQLRQLESVYRQIQRVLNQLEIIRGRYQGVDMRRRVWDRTRFPQEDVRHLQTQLQSYMMNLNFLLESLGSEMLGRVLQVVEETAAQNRLLHLNWESLLRVLRERGVAEEDVAAHRDDIEEIVQAAHNVAESERNLSPDSSVRSSTGSSSAQSTTTRGTTVNGDDTGMGDNGCRIFVGPPTQAYLRSRICLGALNLQNGTYGMKQKRRRLPMIGTSRYRIECTNCKFVGFQDDELDNPRSPTNTPLFFSAREPKLTASSLEYHIDIPGRKERDAGTDGLFYRTLFFWKCHVEALTETLHDGGTYECPFCEFSEAAGLSFGRPELLEHILGQHVQQQPSHETRVKFNCWIGVTPLLFGDEYSRIQGRNFDIMLPRPYSDREGTMARIKRDVRDDNV